jgi:hypothetical protein
VLSRPMTTPLHLLEFVNREPWGHKLVMMKILRKKCCNDGRLHESGCRPTWETNLLRVEAVEMEVKYKVIRSTVENRVHPYKY